MLQVPDLAAPTHCEAFSNCFEWETVIGFQKFWQVTIPGAPRCSTLRDPAPPMSHDNSNCPSPFDTEQGLGVSIVVFALTLFQARVYVAQGGGAGQQGGVSCAATSCSPPSPRMSAAAPLACTRCRCRYDSDAFKALRIREKVSRKLAAWRLISEVRVQQVGKHAPGSGFASGCRPPLAATATPLQCVPCCGCCCCCVGLSPARVSVFGFLLCDFACSLYCDSRFFARSGKIGRAASDCVTWP